MKYTKERGITLISLVVTIIIFLILVGVGIVIVNKSIINSAIIASNETIENSIKEQIELAWNACYMAYWNDKLDDTTLDEKQYMKENLETYLSDLKEIDKIEIKEVDQNNINILYEFQNKIYTFSISSDGKTSLKCLLKGNVKVGEYINYPIEYYDVYSKKHYSSQKGWRVIDDGVMEGTSGCVKIVSAGIPVKWSFTYDSLDNTADKAIDELNNHFEDNIFKNVFGKKVNGYEFLNNEIANRITSLSLGELNIAYNVLYNMTRENNDVSRLLESDDLFCFQNPEAFYWLSTSKGNQIYYINKNNISLYSDMRMGIRPVIYLNENLYGKQILNVWSIEK